MTPAQRSLEAAKAALSLGQKFASDVNAQVDRIYAAQQALIALIQLQEAGEQLVRVELPEMDTTERFNAPVAVMITAAAVSLDREREVLIGLMGGTP